MSDTPRLHVFLVRSLDGNTSEFATLASDAEAAREVAERSGFEVVEEPTTISGSASERRFGPQTLAIHELHRRARRLHGDAAYFFDPSYDEDMQAAIDACNEAIDSSGRRMLMDATAAEAPSMSGDFGARAVSRAVAALLTRDLVDPAGTYTPDHYRILGQAWVTNVGLLHPDDEFDVPDWPEPDAMARLLGRARVSHLPHPARDNDSDRFDVMLDWAGSPARLVARRAHLDAHWEAISQIVTDRIILAAAYAVLVRHLVGDVFTQADYDAMTSGYRAVFGQAHPGDGDGDGDAPQRPDAD